MLSYDAKMFKEKPYTQCFECVQGNRLKCKKCMQVLIENVLHDRSGMQGHERKRKIGSHKTYLPSANKVFRISKLTHKRRATQQDCEVSTVYEIWMGRMKAQRQKNIGIGNIAVQRWPFKKAASNKKLEKIESPKFENWQARLLKRFSSASAQHLGMNTPHKIR